MNTWITLHAMIPSFYSHCCLGQCTHLFGPFHNIKRPQTEVWHSQLCREVSNGNPMQFEQSVLWPPRNTLLTFGWLWINWACSKKPCSVGYPSQEDRRRSCWQFSFPNCGSNGMWKITLVCCECCQWTARSRMSCHTVLAGPDFLKTLHNKPSFMYWSLWELQLWINHCGSFLVAMKFLLIWQYLIIYTVLYYVHII